MYCRSFHQRSDFDLVALPGFNRDGAGKIFQLEPDILSGRKVPRHALLSKHGAGKDQNQQRDQSRRLSYLGNGGGWVDVHRAINNLRAFDFAHSLKFGKLL